MRDAFSRIVPTAVEPSGVLPRLSITTDSDQLPQNKVDYLWANYQLNDPGGTVQTGRLQIRGRGNSTWSIPPKKPWRLRFESKQQPLGMRSNERNWGLLAEWYDRSRMSNHFAFALGNALSGGTTGLRWTPQHQHVSLTLNGNWHGLYSLADLVRMDSTRVQGDEIDPSAPTGEGDWLVELSNKEAPYSDVPEVDTPGFTTPAAKHWVIYDSPEAPPFHQYTWIEDRIDEFEFALRNGNSAQDYADYQSFADWYLVNELLATADAGGMWSSVKLRVHDSKLVLGPLWDHDLSMGRGWQTTFPADQWRIRNTQWFANSGLWGDLWSDSDWRAIVKTRWAVIRDVIGDGSVGQLPLSTGGTGSFTNFCDDLNARIRPYALADDDHWGLWDGYQNLTFDQAFSQRRQWLPSRVAWLSQRFAQDL